MVSYITNSLSSRVLSFLYLPAHNAWMSLYPWVLAYDWQLGAIPLVDSIEDQRNLATLILYLTIALLLFSNFRSKVGYSLFQYTFLRPNSLSWSYSELQLQSYLSKLM